MRYQGKITKWNDEKGFGFVLQNGTHKEVFLHISSLHNRGKRPQVSQLVSFELNSDSSGRQQAVNVSFVATRNQSSDFADTKYNPWFASYIFVFYALVTERTYQGNLPLEYFFVFIGANLLAFLFYYIDKTAAIQGKWRRSEDSLHLLSLLGGWPAAYIAQKMFLHKYKKTSFMVVYIITVIINSSLVVMYSIPKLLSLFSS